MVRYSKKYGNITNNVVTWGIEIVLGHFFDLSKNNIYQPGKTGFFGDMPGVAKKSISKKQMANMMYHLKKEKYIEVIDVKENSIRLTNKAKIRMIEKIASGEKTDNKKRYISFDIPERLHQNRDNFRRAIKKMGFLQIQQSLWVINKNVGNLVELASCEYGVEDYVAYIVSESSNIEQHVDKTLNKQKINEI